MKMIFVLFFISLVQVLPGQAATTTSDIKPWPQTTIPYIIETDVPKKVQEDVRRALSRINSLRILKLTPAKNQSLPSILFTYKKHACSSSYGWRDETSTMIRVSADCTYGTILHEILHALGMVHEQLNPLRYFSINMDRVWTSNEDQFDDKNTIALTTHDPHSIMHYNSWGFSICDSLSDPKWKVLPSARLPHASCMSSNWRTKLGESNPVDCSLECAVFLSADHKSIGGQRKDLSLLDIEGLRKLYK